MRAEFRSCAKLGNTRAELRNLRAMLGKVSAGVREVLAKMLEQNLVSPKFVLAEYEHAVAISYKMNAR